MVFTLLLVPLRETICFHLRRALYCRTQHFFFFNSEDYHRELSPQTQEYSVQPEILLSGVHKVTVRGGASSLMFAVSTVWRNL